mmetsp:Transcript_108345/g.334651  ORF Transcript_108345/g.334651 Transcript_108345/m.334651 type:complete len:382 (+) Transcript_108345:122-1267(+)
MASLPGVRCSLAADSEAACCAWRLSSWLGRASMLQLPHSLRSHTRRGLTGLRSPRGFASRARPTRASERSRRRARTCGRDRRGMPDGPRGSCARWRWPGGCAVRLGPGPSPRSPGRRWQPGRRRRAPRRSRGRRGPRLACGNCTGRCRTRAACPRIGGRWPRGPCGPRPPWTRTRSCAGPSQTRSVASGIIPCPRQEVTTTSTGSPSAESASTRHSWGTARPHYPSRQPSGRATFCTRRRGSSMTSIGFARSAKPTSQTSSRTLLGVRLTSRTPHLSANWTTSLGRSAPATPCGPSATSVRSWFRVSASTTIVTSRGKTARGSMRRRTWRSPPSAGGSTRSAVATTPASSRRTPTSPGSARTRPALTTLQTVSSTSTGGWS